MDTIFAGQEGPAYTAVPVPHVRFVDEAEVLVPMHLDGDETYYDDAKLLRDAKLALWEFEMNGGQVVGSWTPVARSVELAVAA